jgi:hypothetical protein
MSKKNHFDPQTVQTIIGDYLCVLRLVKGQAVAEGTKVTHKDGFFYIRPPGCKPDAVVIPLRRKEFIEKTLALGKRVPARADSDSDGEMD